MTKTQDHFNCQVFSLHRCYCPAAESPLTLCDRMDCSMPSVPVLHYVPELAQTHAHGVGDRQGGLACCDSWGRKELDTTERLN